MKEGATGEEIKVNAYIPSKNISSCNVEIMRREKSKWNLRIFDSKCLFSMFKFGDVYQSYVWETILQLSDAFKFFSS